jgi:hypothetical protein
MNKNSVIKRLPFPLLKLLVKLFRKSNRIYERLEFIYHAKISDDNIASVRTEHIESLSPQDMDAVFVLSTGRCGTKTLTWLMDTHSSVSSHHEPHPQLIEISYLYFMRLCPEIPYHFWQSLLKWNRDSLITSAWHSNQIYFESNNRLALIADLTASRYKKAKFIHLVRHPYSFVHSAMRRQYYDNHVWDFTRIHPRTGEPYADLWDKLSNIEKCAWLWIQTNSNILNILERLPQEQKLFVQSEKIFSGDTETIRSLFQFVSGGENTPSQKQIEKVLGSKINKQYSGSFPPPEEWNDETIAMVNKHVRKLMDKFGYGI